MGLARLGCLTAIPVHGFVDFNFYVAAKAASPMA
jgi:hypothetical protein